MSRAEKVLFKIKNTPEKYLFPVFAAIAFFIPLFSSVSDVLTYVVLAIFITYTALNRKQLNQRRNEMRTITILGISLFILTFFHLFTANNKDAVYSQMDQFTAILVFPLMLTMLSSGKDYSRQINTILNISVAGTVISTLLLFLLAGIRFFKTGDNTEFYYINLGDGIHPSYMSIFVVFAIAILLDGRTYMKVFRYTGPIAVIIFIGITWLLIFNTLLSSKAGIIIQTVILLLYTLRAFYRKLYYKGITLLLLTFVSILIIPILFSFTANRFIYLSDSLTELTSENQTDESKYTSTNSRLLGWQAAVDLILDNPYIGVGPGNVQDDLKESYEKHGLEYGYRNPHNQYIQTWLELGLPGLIILILLISVSGWLAIRNKNYIYLSFIIIICMHMFFESILERRLGIVTFAFWNSIFWLESSPYVVKYKARRNRSCQ